MPLLDTRELISEWAPGYYFGLQPNIMTDKNTNADDVVDCDNNEDNIIDYILGDDDSDNDDSLYHSEENNIVDKYNDIDEISQNEHVIMENMVNDDVIDDDVINEQINDNLYAYTPLEDVL